MMIWSKLWKSIILESPNILYIMHVTHVRTNSLLYIPTPLFAITGINTLKQTAESMKYLRRFNISANKTTYAYKL